MRFKSLPDITQLAIADALAEFIDNQPADLYYPTADSGVWWGALLHFNVRLRATSQRALADALRLKNSIAGLISLDAFEKVVEAVEYVVWGDAPEHGTCDFCGETY